MTGSDELKSSVAPPNPLRTPTARAARSGSVYALVGVLQRGVPLLLLPFYTTALDPSQYGEITVLVAVTAIVGAVLGLGLETTVLRSAVQLAGQPAERLRFTNTVGLIAIGVPLAGSILGAVAFAILAGDTAPGGTVLLAFLAIAFQTTTTVFVSALLRADERLRRYAYLALGHVVLGATLGVILVVALRMGSFGWFAAAAGSSLVTLAFGLTSLRHRWRPEISRDHARHALEFGLPLVPHSASHWVLNLSDRLLIAALVGAADAGIYNLAYQVAAPVGLLAASLRQGLAPLYAAAAKSADLRDELSRLATLQVHVTAWLSLAVAMLGPVVILTMFPAGYASASTLVPWIALGYAMFGFYLIPVDTVSMILGKTRRLWIPTLVAAVANVALNAFLIPRIGVAAAAINTAVAYGLLLLGVSWYLRSLSGPRVRYEFSAMGIGVGACLAAWAIGSIAAPEPLGVGFVVRTLVVVGAGIVLWWLGRRSAGARSPFGKLPNETSGAGEDPVVGDPAGLLVARG